MKISCPYCGQHYEVDESFYGHRIKCSVCGRKSELPAPDRMEKAKTQRFDPLPESDVKQCPYCGETIKAVAVKCRYCGSMLGGSSSVVPSSCGSDLIYRLLCFFFGTIGIHNFYAGENKKGVFKIILLIAGIVAAAPCPPAGLIILGLNSVLVLIELIYGYPKR